MSIDISLPNKIQYFFSSKYRERDDVSTLVKDLSKNHHIIIFGGMLRDIILDGNRKFDSDVDIVIFFENKEHENLQSILHGRNYQINKFGGCRLNLGSWDVDIWELESTWAFKNNLLPLTGLESIIETAFFNWDAIAFDFTTKSLIKKDSYMEDLTSRILDINFEANPNPKGILKRIHKFTNNYQAKLTPKVVSYYIKNYEKFYTPQSHNSLNKEIAPLYIENLYHILRNHQDTSTDKLFVLQDELFHFPTMKNYKD